VEDVVLGLAFLRNHRHVALDVIAQNLLDP
jgi:hypothetical protein